MADLLIRNLDDDTRAALKAQARQRGRSMSAEALALVRNGLRPVAGVEEGGLGWASRFLAERGPSPLTDEDAAAFEAVLTRVRGLPGRPPPTFEEE